MGNDTTTNAVESLATFLVRRAQTIDGASLRQHALAAPCSESEVHIRCCFPVAKLRFGRVAVTLHAQRRNPWRLLVRAPHSRPVPCPGPSSMSPLLSLNPSIGFSRELLHDYFRLGSPWVGMVAAGVPQSEHPYTQPPTHTYHQLHHHVEIEGDVCASQANAHRPWCV